MRKGNKPRSQQLEWSSAERSQKGDRVKAFQGWGLPGMGLQVGEKGVQGRGKKQDAKGRGNDGAGGADF